MESEAVTALQEISSQINAELIETIPEGETDFGVDVIQYANGLEFALLCITNKINELKKESK